MNITVYLGAREPDNPALTIAARELGTWIGANNHRLIYGGSHCGLMGKLAVECMVLYSQDHASMETGCWTEVKRG